MSPTNIRLVSMSLQNFKGVRSFYLDILGHNASVYGENGTGKTTLYDAFLWLLFSKDSSNRSDFSVKTHDAGGQEVHGLEHQVEATLDVNGSPLKLRKMLTEKWTKKRGEAQKEFTGHETSYWVDDVPVKKGKYQQMIDSIINEDIFKLLTNPFYFNAQLSWQDRRKTLLAISGDLTDSQVIASDERLAELAKILDGKSTEDYRKIIQERIKRLNDEIAKIPVRIDELSKSLPQVEDYSSVEAELSQQKTLLTDIEKKLTSVMDAANAYRLKQQKVFRLQSAIEERKGALETETGAVVRQLQDELAKHQNEKYRLESEAQSLKFRVQQKQTEFDTHDSQLKDLRVQWATEFARRFEEPDPNTFTCPTCGQALPGDQCEQDLEKMRAKFEATKQAAIDRIDAQGKTLATLARKAWEDKCSFKEQISKNEADALLIAERIAELEKEIAEELLRKGQPDVESDGQYQALKTELDGLLAELDKHFDDGTGLLDQKQQVINQIEELNRTLNNREVAQRTKARIDELKAEERTLAEQLGELERQKFLIEQFIKTKVNLLEDSINSRFTAVTFKLFDTQINGGIVECCETMVNGVPWPDVNHAGKVNAGLDIINSLAGHYGYTAPIFVDFRESVSRLIPTESQIINLVKSEPDKTLRVEVEN